MEFHGTADPLGPYDGGGTPQEPSVPDTFAGVGHGGDGTLARGAYDVKLQTSDATCSTYGTCRARGALPSRSARSTVEATRGPGGMPVLVLGYDDDDPPAPTTAAMWSFFLQHLLR